SWIRLPGRCGPGHRDDGAWLDRDPLHVPGRPAIQRPQVHMQIRVLWSEDATMSARAEAEDLDGLALQLEARLGALVTLGVVGQPVPLVENVEGDGGRRRAEEECERGADVEPGRPRPTQHGLLQRLLVADGLALDVLAPVIDVVVDEEAGLLVRIGRHVYAPFDNTRDPRLAVENRDLSGHPGQRAERIEMGPIREGAQLDLAL